MFWRSHELDRGRISTGDKCLGGKINSLVLRAGMLMPPAPCALAPAAPEQRCEEGQPRGSLIQRDINKG